MNWCLLLLLAVGVVVVFTQPRYAQLQEVAVAGVSRLDAEQVKGVCGLRPGQSVWGIEVTVRKETEIAIPAYTGSLRFQFARAAQSGGK